MEKPIDTSTNQKTPSKWMILAIAQSILFMLGTPLLCHKYWDRLFGSMHQHVAEFLLSSLTPITVYTIYSLVMLPIYYMQHPFLEQFKIQRDRSWPWLDEREHVRRQFWKLTFRSVKFTLCNLFVLLPLMAISKIILSNITGTEDPNLFQTDPEHWPTLMENTRNMILLALFHEFGFYSTHRIMHTYPSLYKYHKVHHEYKMNTTLASQHNHPIDFILSIGGPALLAVFIVNPHSSTLFQFTVWTMVANLDDHVGYSFPWSPVRWFPFSAATDEHEFHHSKNLGCFASKLSIYNSLLGGYEYYDNNNKKRKI